MNGSEIKLGVGVSIAVALLVVFPLFDFLMADCFFEGGCQPHEGWKVLGVFALACLLGAIVGWASMKLSAVLNKGE